MNSIYEIISPEKSDHIINQLSVIINDNAIQKSDRETIVNVLKENGIEIKKTYTMDEPLIGAENFEVVKVVNMVVEKSSIHESRLSGWAIKDKRNNKLISMQDDYFYCLWKRKTALSFIAGGLYDGFTHFDELK